LQTETARFWLVGPPAAYHPFVRQLVTAKQMSVVESAPLMARVAVGFLAADRDCSVLARRPARGLSPLRTPTRDSEADECRRERAAHGTRGDWDQRCNHRRARCKVPLQLL